MGANTYLDLKKVPKHIARVIICYDALSQLRQRKINPEDYGYLNLGGNFLSPSSEESQLDKEVDAKGCVACALGTLLVCRARVFDEIKASDFINRHGTGSGESIFTELQGFFDKDQLSLIEYTFEAGPTGYAAIGLFDHDLRAAALAFAYQFKTRKSRLIAILKNIINNEGTFVPSQKRLRKKKG